MKKIKTFILCGLILVSGMFSKHVFAGGIDDIKNEFITQCRNFKRDGKIWKRKAAIIDDMSAQYYFSKLFDKANIDNGQTLIGSGSSVGLHFVNGYTIGEKSYLADFLTALTDSDNASRYFAIPIMNCVEDSHRRYEDEEDRKNAPVSILDQVEDSYRRWVEDEDDEEDEIVYDFIEPIMRCVYFRFV